MKTILTKKVTEVYEDVTINNEVFRFDIVNDYKTNTLIIKSFFSLFSDTFVENEENCTIESDFLYAASDNYIFIFEDTFTMREDIPYNRESYLHVVEKKDFEEFIGSKIHEISKNIFEKSGLTANLLNMDSEVFSSLEDNIYELKEQAC